MLGVLLLALSAFGSDAPFAGTLWTAQTGAVAGHPVPLPSADAAEAILVTSGERLLLIDPAGRIQKEMKLDRPAAAAPIAGHLWNDTRIGIVAFDIWGSVYCFDREGRRLWKHTRESNMGPYRLPVLADLDGDKAPEILLTDSLGYLIALDNKGRVRLELQATRYRLSPPVVADVDGDGHPEIFFSDDDKEVICTDYQGRVRWTRKVDGRFGRALPLVADTAGDGRYKLLIPSSFVAAKPGIWALDAITGEYQWKAESLLQTYQSTVVADLDGDGSQEVLFADKNTSVYCADAQGKRRWATLLDGRGIFFAPAVADLDGSGQATIFQAARDQGENGQSLYALNAQGKIVQTLPLPGGGGFSPSLVRFKGDQELKLVVASKGGQLLCIRLAQNGAKARALWSTMRGSDSSNGFVPSKHKVTVRAVQLPALAALERRDAVEGVNHVITDALPASVVASIQAIAPDGAIQSRIIRNDRDAFQVRGDFTAVAPGTYKVFLTTLEAEGGRVLTRRQFVYTMAPAFAGINARQTKFESRLNPARRDLHDWAVANTRASLSFARTSNTAELFNSVRSDYRYYNALLDRVAADKPAGAVVVYQIPNPWPATDLIDFLRQTAPKPNQLSLTMAGNEYESIGLTISNLGTRAASFHIECNTVGTTPAPKVLEFREVPLITNAYPRQPNEDVLPKLGEGNLMRLGPLETRKLWITVHSRDLAAGDHKAKIRIGDIASSALPVEVALDVHVSRTRLPEKRTFRQENWLFFPGGAPDADLEERTFAEALAHGVNVFNVPAISLRVDAEGNVLSANIEAHDHMINKLRGRALFLTMGSIGIEWPKDFKPSTELADKTYAMGIRWYATHMKRLGLDYSDYALYIQDEPGLLGYDKSWETWVANLKRIKAADPKMRIYADPAGGAKPEILKPVAHLLSILQPDLHLVRENPEGMKDAVGSAEYWQYEAPGDQRNLDPLGFYRMKPWVSFQMGMVGGGYWVYQYTPLWLLDPTLGPEYGAVYPTATGPVTTKRWEASRDGIEDYELLNLLRTRAGNSPEARKLLDDAVAYVTRGQEHVSDISRQLRAYTPDYPTWMQYRSKIIDMIERLPQ